MIEAFGLGPLQLGAAALILIVFVFAGSAKNRRGARRALPAAGRVLPFVVSAAVVYLGVTSFGGVFGLSNIQLLVATGVLVIAMYVTVTSETELSFPFWLTFVPLVLVVLEVAVPSFVTSRLTPLYEIVGVSPSGLDSFQVLIFSLLGVLAYWAVQFRAGSGSDNADTITKKILGSGRDGRKGELTKLGEDYVTMARLSFAFAFSLAFFAFSQGGQLSAEAASFLADAPVVASNLAAGAIGFFALGGGLPEWLAWIPGLEALTSALGGLGPTAFLAVVVVLIAVAYGSRERLQDYRAKLARERAKKRQYKQEAEGDDG
jgi:hypothetical protein